MRNIIPLDEVPAGVKNDLAKYFETVSYVNYGDPITVNCTSLRSHFMQTLEENIQRLDPLTQTTRSFNRQIAFIVRGEMTSNKKIDVYAIITAGEVLVPVA